MTAAAYTATDLIRAAILRARWAWRCRGQPPPRAETAPLTYEEIKALSGIITGRKRTARPEEPDVKALAIVLWVAAWFAVAVSVAATWSYIRGHDRALAVAPAAAILAAGLAWAGAVLW